MDGVAWLSLPDENETVQRKDFEAWADKYFIPEMKRRGYLDITGEDLYAARCALVHTQTAEAILTREPLKSTAREIYYREGDQTGMVNLMANSPRPALFIAPSDLFTALEGAIQILYQDMQQDTDIKSHVLGRAGKHFAHCTFL